MLLGVEDAECLAAHEALEAVEVDGFGGVARRAASRSWRAKRLCGPRWIGGMRGRERHGVLFTGSCDPQTTWSGLWPAVTLSE
jgi:hypothetical protein